MSVIRPRGTRSTESEECPDPTKIFDTECIVETFRAGRGWMAIHHKDPAWWRSFKLLVKEYILKTRFYNTMPAMHSTSRVRGYEYELWLNASEYSRLSVFG